MTLLLPVLIVSPDLPLGISRYSGAGYNFEDDISELSSIASYLSSPGIFSQKPIELEDAINIPDINLESSRSQVSSSLSDYLVPYETQNPLQ